MAVFLFFGGSEAHPRAWDRCRACLEAGGHTSRVIDWVQAPWEAGWPMAIGHLAREIGVVRDAVLVGHSMAGLFLSLLGEKIKARREIYLAALVPHPGRTMYDRLFEGEEIFPPEWTALYQELMATPDHPLTRRKVEEFLFHDGPGDPYAGFWRPFPLPLDLFYDVDFPLMALAPRPRHYIVCSEDRTVCPQWQRKAALELREASRAAAFPLPFTELATGHSPHVTRPQELAALLEALA